jgi:hypothetical protein
MSSLKRHFGWLMLDHSASPGIPPDVARKMGLPAELVGEGKVAEMHTLSCCHCGSHVMLNPKRTRARGYCRSCDHYICDGCDYLRSLPDYSHHRREESVTV